MWNYVILTSRRRKSSTSGIPHFKKPKTATLFYVRVLPNQTDTKNSEIPFVVATA